MSVREMWNEVVQKNDSGGTVSVCEMENTFSRENDSVRGKVLPHTVATEDWSWAYTMGMIRDHVAISAYFLSTCPVDSCVHLWAPEATP